VCGPRGIAPNLTHLAKWPPWFLDESGGRSATPHDGRPLCRGRHRTGDPELRCLTQGGAGLSGPLPTRREQLGDCQGKVR